MALLPGLDSAMPAGGATNTGKLPAVAAAGMVNGRVKPWVAPLATAPVVQVTRVPLTVVAPTVSEPGAWLQPGGRAPSTKPAGMTVSMVPPVAASGPLLR